MVQHYFHISEPCFLHIVEKHLVSIILNSLEVPLKTSSSFDYPAIREVAQDRVLGKCPPASDSYTWLAMNSLKRTVRFGEIEQTILGPTLHGGTSKSFLSYLIRYSNKLINSHNFVEFQGLF